MMSEDHLESLKACLNRDKVKLWLPPFTQDDNSPANYSQEMLIKYSTELNVPLEHITSLLETLRKTAVDNLKAKKDFQNSGVATLRVKVPSGHLSTQLEIKTKLNITGHELKLLIARQISFEDPSYFKVIATGRVLQEQNSLEAQNIKNNTRLMVLFLHEQERNQLINYENQFSKLEEVKRMTNLLSAASDNYMMVSDQRGEALDMPASERQALTLALTLHEKGRTLLKARTYSEALVYFIEADEAFNNCQASILSRVDNYAVLCLDIAWCYLCLQSFSHLPEADKRLRMCEEGFYKSYGTNLERLTQLKGDTSSEQALFVRLHLLQAVVAYHNNNIVKSRSLLTRAEEGLRTLKVDDGLLVQVMNMGFEKTEARIGLRRAKGNVEIAINYIMSQREEEEQLRQKDNEKYKQRKLEEKLGKTQRGEKVNISSYKSLVQMGFNKARVIEALRATENDVSQAVLWLSKSQMVDSNDFEEHLVKLQSMGLPAADARAVLKKFNGDYNKALQHFGLAKPLSTSSSTSTSSTSTSSASSSSSEPDLKALANTLAKDLPGNKEDHLDISLEEEEHFLNHYKRLIEKDNNTVV